LDTITGGFAIELGFNTGEKFTFTVGNTEAIKRFFDLEGNVIPGMFSGLIIGEIVANFVEIEILGGIGFKDFGHWYC
jgi:hypothetical protein